MHIIFVLAENNLKSWQQCILLYWRIFCNTFAYSYAFISACQISNRKNDNKKALYGVVLFLMLLPPTGHITSTLNMPLMLISVRMMMLLLMMIMPQNEIYLLLYNPTKSYKYTYICMYIRMYALLTPFINFVFVYFFSYNNDNYVIIIIMLMMMLMMLLMR